MHRAGLVMYTNTEPCPTCAGGIATAGVGGVVHLVSAEAGAAVHRGYRRTRRGEE